MVTRVSGNDWIVLEAEDHGYHVTKGAVFNWSDSFCSRMVLGLGPRMATNACKIPAYASAPIGRLVPIGAYVGIPLSRADGTLFGTLCAIHPNSVAETVAEELPLIELLGQLLGTVLESNMTVEKSHRQAERAMAIAMNDSLTGLYNRRGWDQLLASEETRCQRYGHSACVITIDLDDLKQVNDHQGHAQGDSLLRNAANAIMAASRSHDIVARVGGDEFMVLGVECQASGADSLVARIRKNFLSASINASVGVSIRDPKSTLAIAAENSDRAMYHEKARRKSIVAGAKFSAPESIVQIPNYSS